MSDILLLNIHVCMCNALLFFLYNLFINMSTQYGAPNLHTRKKNTQCIIKLNWVKTSNSIHPSTIPQTTYSRITGIFSIPASSATQNHVGWMPKFTAVFLLLLLLLIYLFIFVFIYRIMESTLHSFTVLGKVTFKSNALQYCVTP